ncbi:MAG TPA: hypothetical protein VFX48_06570, partial [Saprospiraceae bacterium]|nr:hypothetical protein [Saprospiraceae bacterium]
MTLVWACKNDSKSDTNSEAAQAESEFPAGATFAVTLDGKRLMEIPEPDTVLAAQKAQLETARSFYLGHLSDVKSYLGYGATALKFGMVELALQILTKGIDKFPNTSDLYLYRGMAAVQGRQFTSAINDLWKAGKAVEGQPNVKGLLEKTPEEIKIDASLHYEIYKWMGLAFQCQGDFSNAEKMYEICSDFSTNSDLYCMAYYWQYQAFVRAGRENDAKAILERADAKMFISPVT